MTLATLQSDFLQASYGDQTSNQALQFHIRSNQISAKDRLSIYQNNIKANATSALRTCYPTVQKLVGDIFFKQTAWHFIQSTPPAGGAFLDYGIGFIGFLEQYDPVQHLPYLSDIARLDWARFISETAQDQTLMTASDWQKFNPHDLANASPKMSDHCQLITLEHPVDRIWSYTQKPDDLAAPDITPAPTYILTYRDKFLPKHLTLTENQFLILSSLAVGDTMGSLTEFLDITTEDLTTTIQIIIQSHFAQKPKEPK